MERIPRTPTSPPPVMYRLFRRGNAYAVWDERGLTVRNPTTNTSYDLAYLAVNPKVFTRDEIKASLKKFETKARSQAPDSLAGSLRVGNSAYFLVRWTEEGKTWGEALVSVDLGAATPKPVLVGKFGGPSRAEKALDDQLFILGGKIAAVTQNGPRWGVSTYDVNSKEFNFVPLGSRLEWYEPTGDGKCVFVESTGYKTQVAGTVDLATARRSVMAESPGKITLIDRGTPMIALVSNTGQTAIRNLETGLEVRVPAGTKASRSKSGIIVSHPGGAALYDPSTWRKLATLSAD